MYVYCRNWTRASIFTKGFEIRIKALNNGVIVKSNFVENIELFKIDKLTII